MQCAGLSGDVKEVILKDLDRERAFREALRLIGGSFPGRKVSVFGNSVGVRVYEAVAQELILGVSTLEIEHALVYVQGTVVDSLRDLRYSMTIAKPFANPFDLREILDGIGYLNALRIEGIEHSLIPDISFKIIGSTELSRMVRTSLTADALIK